MKRKSIFLILLVLFSLLISCTPKDIEDYHEVGDTWNLYYNEELCYEIDYEALDDHTMTLAITLQEGHEEDDFIRFYSTGKEISCNETLLSEVWIEAIFPIGMIEVPVESLTTTIQITTDEEPFHGKVKFDLSIHPTSTETLLMFTMETY